ncbi:MAG: hypothetical protein H6811_05375 [Phycisphaeraceae bacterium]|nr:hypothetical protein [Phycisphaeraceae bacterium]
MIALAILLTGLSGCVTRGAWTQHELSEASGSDVDSRLTRLRQQSRAGIAHALDRTREVGSALQEMGAHAGTVRGYRVAAERTFIAKDNSLALGVFRYENTGVSHAAQENVVILLADDGDRVIWVDQRSADRLAEPPQLWSSGNEEFIIVTYSGPWYSQSAASDVVVYRLDRARSLVTEAASVFVPERHARQQPLVGVSATAGSLIVRVQDTGVPDPLIRTDQLDVMCSDDSCSIEERTQTRIRIRVRGTSAAG